MSKQRDIQKNHSKLVFPFAPKLVLVCVLVILLGACAPFAPPGNQAVGKVVTFTPKSLSSADVDVANPWRGAYDWYHNEAVPNLAYTDSYTRYDWKEIEPSQGHYDFSSIDAELAAAKARHGKFGFRIMPSGVDNIAVPDYLVALMPHGQWLTNTSSGQQAYEPDWNDPAYLARATALLTALGQRYSNDPRLGWIDMFPYGDWGEWHTYGFPDDVIAPMSLENQKKLIDANLAAFSHKRIVMLTDSPEALSYALERSPRIGIRIDCLGTPEMGGAIVKLGAVPLVQERWKTAPVIFEACTSIDFQTALSQVKTYHGAMIGDGNFASYTNYSAPQQQSMKQTFAASGYRFVLNTMTLPSRIPTGTDFTVTTQWSNLNVTPAYNPWNMMIRLQNSSGVVIWQGKSKLDVQTLLPTTNSSTMTNTPTSVTDTFNLPSTISTGTYTVSVQGLDPENYYAPLNLALQGRATDGSYTLGTISVAE